MLVTKNARKSYFKGSIFIPCLICEISDNRIRPRVIPGGVCFRGLFIHDSRVIFL